MIMLNNSAQGPVLKPKDNSSGFYCYIGPSITGIIQHGTIEKYPLVKTLIVSGDALPEARLKIKRPGNALYVNYRKIAGLR